MNYWQFGTVQIGCRGVVGLVCTRLESRQSVQCCTGGFKVGQKGHAPPKMPQVTRGLSRAYLNKPSTAKSRQLLGDFCPADPLNWPPPSSFSGSAPAGLLVVCSGRDGRTRDVVAVLMLTVAVASDRQINTS